MADEKYRKLIQEKSDANLEFYAKLLDDSEDFDYRSSEDIEIPPELDDKMLELCRRLDKEKASSKRRKRIIKYSKRCAVFLVCFATLSAFSIASVDAWRVKFTDLFFENHEDHISLVPTNKYEIEGWNNYYTLGELPDGYEFEYAKDLEIKTVIVFSNNYDTISIYQYLPDLQVNIDGESSFSENVDINGNSGVYSVINKQDLSEASLKWLQNDILLELVATDIETISKNDLIDLAENIKYVKK